MNKLEILEKVKQRFGIEHTEQDDVLTDLIEDAESHFKMITGATEIKPDHEFIIKDVVSIRYNRLSSYGLTSESKGDYSATYRDPSLDFQDYIPFLDREYGFLGGYEKGRVYFT